MSRRSFFAGRSSQLDASRIGNFVIATLLAFGIALAILVSMSIMPELHWRTLAQSSATHKEAAITLRQRDEIADRVDAYRRTYYEMLTDPDPNTNLLVRSTELFKLIRFEQERLVAAEAALTTLRGKQNGAAAIGDLQMARQPWNRSHFVWATPGQLVLSLTMLMGALGGIIAVARAFLQPSEDNPQRFSDCLIRPLMGAVIAFVIYMLVQIGQIVLTASGSPDPLNPYPVALVAIVAGMMSTEAIAAIERWGKSLFERLSATSFGSSVGELTAKLNAEKTRLAEATTALGTTPPVPADPTAPTAQETNASTAYDNAKKALTAANNALSSASAAIQKLSADASASAVQAANRALSELTNKVTNAVSQTSAIR